MGTGSQRTHSNQTPRVTEK